MISENKVNQVITSIKENGIETFPVESLVKLLSILTKEELKLFENKIILEDPRILDRYLRVEKMVSNNIDNKLKTIRNGNLIVLLNESLINNRYREYLNNLTIPELADIKYYMSNSVNVKDENNISGTKKIINIITDTIQAKEKENKPSFD